MGLDVCYAYLPKYIYFTSKYIHIYNAVHLLSGAATSGQGECRMVVAVAFIEI